MPRDGSGIYSTPPGTHGTPNTTILSANYNSNVDDVATDLNTPRPIVAGGTGATTAAGALTALGAVAKAGDTMTGALTTIGLEVRNPAGASISIDTATVGSSTTTNNAVVGARNGVSRWSLILGGIAAETGSNTGSDFAIASLNDGGGLLGFPLQITRQTGVVQIGPGPSTVDPTQVKIGNAIGGGIGFRPALDNNYACIFTAAGGSNVGNIYTTATTTLFATSSDDRLKEDLKSFDAGNIVDETEVYDFKWRTTGERAYGVIAQQAIEVYPTAVVNTDDQWAVDYSKYVPVLLQELKALRVRVAALEGGGLSGKPT